MQYAPRFAAAILPLFIVFFAQAQTVKQILTEENKAAIQLEAEGGANAGDILLATSADGKNCPLKVQSVNGTAAVVDLSKCTFKDQIKVGDHLEKSLIPASPSLPSTPAAPIVNEHLDSNEFGDLGYLVPTGAVVATFGAQYSQSKTTVDLLTAPFFETKSSGTDFVYNIAYGIVDRWSLILDGRYNFQSGSDTSYFSGSTLNGTSEHTDSSGPSEPNLEFQYRAVEEKTSGFNLDLLLGYSPKLITSKSATKTDKGNNGRGGDLITLSASAEKKMRVLEIAGSVEVRKYGKETTANATTGSESNADEHTNVNLTLIGRYSLNERFHILGGLEDSMYSSITVKSSSTTQVSSYDQFGILAGGDMMLKKDVSFLRLLITSMSATGLDILYGTNKATGSFSGTGVLLEIVSKF